jgi:Fe-S-cluster-containing dehydrogenase component/DMSO reductase anchor subunit
MACNHCKDAPCLSSCPAAAYSRDGVTQAVIHNPDRCIGCKYCTWVCPFDAPRFNPLKGIVEKCHLCNHRLLEGMAPACASLCPTGALTFGHIEVNPTIAALGLSAKPVYPRVELLRYEVANSKPEMDAHLNDYNTTYAEQLFETAESKIEALAEWPLVMFTLITSFTVGWFSAQLLKPDIYFSPSFFIGLNLLGGLLSVFHLGRPIGAYRSVLNLKTSWLSREIFLFGLFNGLAVLHLLFTHNLTVAYFAAMAGWGLLLAVERVYSPIDRKTQGLIHSANTLLTGILVLSMLVNPITGMAVLAIKAFLYAIRYPGSQPPRNRKRMLITAFRVVLGFAIPIVFIGILDQPPSAFIVASVLAGELIDRFQFYDNLHVTTPQHNLIRSLRNETLHSK